MNLLNKLELIGIDGESGLASNIVDSPVKWKKIFISLVENLSKEEIVKTLKIDDNLNGYEEIEQYYEVSKSMVALSKTKTPSTYKFLRFFAIEDIEKIDLSKISNESIFFNKTKKIDLKKLMKELAVIRSSAIKVKILEILAATSVKKLEKQYGMKKLPLNKRADVLEYFKIPSSSYNYLARVSTQRRDKNIMKIMTYVELKRSINGITGNLQR